MANVAISRPPQFLFLPNNTKCFTKPDDDLRRTINRHVQRHTRRKRKYERLPDHSRIIDLVHEESHARTPQLYALGAESPVGKLVESVEPDESIEDVDECLLPTKPADAMTLVRVNVPQPQTYLDTSRMDPFSTSRVTLTPAMAPIYSYYFSTIMPVVEPVHQEREEYNSWLVPLTHKEPALLYALLACMAYDLEEISSSGFGPGRRRDMMNQRVQYKVLAIQALNRSLADPKSATEASTLIAVHFLLWQEMFTDEDCVHIDGVKRLLELRGGFNGIQRKAIEAIMVGNTWRAIRTRARPILPKVVDELPMSEARFRDILAGSDPCVAKTSSELLNPTMRLYFSADFWRLLQDSRAVWICFEQIGTFPFEPLEKRHISIKRVNIDHRFLSYVLDHPDDVDHSPIQEVVRLAIILYSSAHYNVVQPSSAVARALITDLKEALEQSDLRNLWNDASNVLLWVLFLGAHMSAGQIERSWFVTAMCKIRSDKLKGDKSWFGARRVLMGCYYSDRVFMESLKRVWKEVETLAGLLSLY